MKKMILIPMLTAALLITAGCGNTSEGTVSKREFKTGSGVQDVLNAGMAAEDSKKASGSKDEIFYDKETGTVPGGRQSGLNENAPEPENPGISPDASNTEEGIDVDLTRLSSTMVYSEVYNMMVYPETYVGKTVKMSGMFNYLYDEVQDFYYFSCIIMDATACCAQGLEFVTTDEFKYPEDYPKLGEDITVTGVFDTYMEGNEMYCTLRNAKLF